jgi:hypothetical protein
MKIGVLSPQPYALSVGSNNSAVFFSGQTMYFMYNLFLLEQKESKTCNITQEKAEYPV